MDGIHKTSTPQRKSENPPEYEKIVSAGFNDNCSVYSDVSKANSNRSRKKSKNRENKSVSIQAPKSRYTEGKGRNTIQQFLQKK